MTVWTADELREFDREDEIHLASHRPDGSLRPFVTMWTVQVAGDVIVRSARGINPWFTRARASGSGRIRIGKIDRDVTFERFEGEGIAFDAVYQRKYRRYGATVVDSVTGSASYERTLRLVPTA